ncbi:MAG: alpha-N-arabinofuranosidase [Bacteroidales bacterium]|nr:alpha-N-arabinofuranosidase [Bacteroidales bacterium]MDD3166565.1 alpha-N-arabinofuranosidase [Bacteroidales bacterium]MDD4771569.1 alpha-N-arabinofuranosidase [Bacteroidales bacterium]HKL93643.1 alpha-N-arabinofuranosidase [Bacteroidales bacterium]
MKKRFYSLSLACLCLGSLFAAEKAEVVVDINQPGSQISRHIYGHFAEHLGRCIYGGIWVGEDSPIPNTKGYRNDIIKAIQHIQIPNLRWPGGCFADEYHWRDGIGPRESRPKMINTHWGGVVEDNSFGTHEFLDYCELVGTEPYVCGNVGSGTVEEMSKWVEYITFDGESPMSNERKANGREKPWKVSFWGVGNENWGCGGNMTPEYYSDLYRQYSTYCRNYGDNKLLKIAGGANSSDYNWTEVLMKNVGAGRMWGLSLHHYTVPKGWGAGGKGSATEFSQEEYFVTMEKALFMDELISKHTAIMDKYDPRKRVAFCVDEWGAWYDVEPGTNPGFLYQQNTLRDALLCAATMNIFHKHSDRVRMANIAQMVNVLQAIILTKEDQLVLTPTYHIYDMYKVHHDATNLPIQMHAPSFSYETRNIPALSVSASKDKNGVVHVSIVNLDPKNDIETRCTLPGAKLKVASGQILTGADVARYNTFENPNEIQLAEFKDAKMKDDQLSLRIPAKSVVTIALK